MEKWEPVFRQGHAPGKNLGPPLCLVAFAGKTWHLVTMPDVPDELPLAAEFPPATREQWRALVEGVLKGAPFDKKLVGRTYDGLAIEPLYQRRPQAQPVVGRAPALPWQLIQRVDHLDPAAGNAEALHDLE